MAMAIIAMAIAEPGYAESDAPVFQILCSFRDRSSNQAVHQSETVIFNRRSRDQENRCLLILLHGAQGS
jgi:hypothetical protein